MEFIPRQTLHAGLTNILDLVQLLFIKKRIAKLRGGKDHYSILKLGCSEDSYDNLESRCMKSIHCIPEFILSVYHY